MNSPISGPTVAPVALQFDPISPAATFPRVARLPRARVPEGAFGTLLRRVDLPASVLTATEYRPRLGMEGGLKPASTCGAGFSPPDRFSCIYRPAYDEHANKFDDGGAVLTAIDLSPAWVDRLREAGFAGERFRVRSPFVDQFGDRLDAELAAPDSMSEVVIGCTVGEYIRRVRVGFARRELATTDKPIAEIAFAAGFSDHSQLTKTFKRLTGRAPSAYRKQIGFAAPSAAAGGTLHLPG